MKLLVTCPNCHTSYQIDEQQVQQSDGQARCYQCHTVFNTMENSRPADEHNPFSTLPDSRIEADSEASSLFVPSTAAEIISGPDDVSLDANSLLLPEESLDINLDDIEPIKPVDKHAAKNKPQYSTAATIGWISANLLLLLVFVSQMGWHYRAQLLQQPQTRDLIELACESLPCQLPPRKQVDGFEIIEREVKAHPEVKGVLSLSLLYVNQSEFEQPTPGLTLSLFDSSSSLIARRSFAPHEYLHLNADDNGLMAQGQKRVVALNLDDPGQDVTGFEFDFF
ncbi:MAG: zinc-ribbon and DUF3426 domain-containing protein [Chromatiales bacterium]|jgi:predicted Zn finger-like uncharacterized protein